MAQSSAANASRPAFGVAELVAFVAALTALNALAIDMMLPALGAIGDDFDVARDNDRQLVIIVYVFASGLSQLVYGPLADRFGRRPVLLVALGGFVAAAMLSVVASSFALLLAARALQGVSSAAGRVVGVAVVRDACSGRRMAEIMSMAMTVFMIAPIVAPSVGQLIMFAAPWRGLFVVLVIFGVVMFAWTYFRLAETLPADKRAPLDPATITRAFVEVAGHRVPLGYTLASLFVFAAFMAYLSVSEQVYAEQFALGAWFPVVFGAVAVAFAAASVLNARLVGRHGMRRISHIAMAVLVGVNAAHLVMAMVVGESLLMFVAFVMLAFFAMGLMVANFSALALEPLGHVAGVASSALGFATMSGSALVGGFIGRTYDGSVLPLVAGFLATSIATLVIVLITENGKLFHSAPSRDSAGHADTSSADDSGPGAA